MRVEARRAADRFRTRRSGAGSWHSFSFGPHYDPQNVSFGGLLAVNEEWLDAGAGFGPHPHAGLEIVTWVVSGRLQHEDSAGHRAVLRPGLVQRLSAGSGVTHSERATVDGPVRLVQMWLAPDHGGGSPTYEVAALPDPFPFDRLVAVASHLPGAGVLGLGQAAASLHAARLRPGSSVALPTAPRVHLQVLLGQVRLQGVQPAQAELRPGHVRATPVLGTSDTARLWDATGVCAAAVSGGARILVWQLQAVDAAVAAG